MAMTAVPATAPGRAAAGLPSRAVPVVSREIVTDRLTVTGRPDAGDRAARRRAAPVRQGRPAGQGPPDAVRRRGVHCAGHGAEIGDISRFGSARKLAARARQIPTVQGTDLKVRHGDISKQGPAWLR